MVSGPLGPKKADLTDKKDMGWKEKNTSFLNFSIYCFNKIIKA